MKDISGTIVTEQPQQVAPTPPTNGRAGKRERIVEAALRLFAQQPYQDVTMDSVSRLAGVAKGTLYLYFESKEALYLGILSDGLEKAAQSYPIDPHAEIAERLRRAIAVSIQFYDAHRDFLRLLATEEPRMAAARGRLLEDFRQRGFDFFSSLIEEGIASGTFRQTDSRLATFAILGAIRAVLLYYGDRRDVAELSHDLGRMIIEGLSAQKNSRKAAPAK